MPSLMDAGLRTPPLHRWLDAASGMLLMALTVCAPWAFGGVPPWARWLVCGIGYTLGLLLLAKHVVRLRAGFEPPRWVSPSPRGVWAVRTLAVLSLVLMEYLVVSGFNARATLQIGHRGVDLLYHQRPPVAWLPTTYDAGGTLRQMALYGALVFTFWAARDWLLGRSRHERHAPETVFFPPARLRQLLWTLSLSSAALALVGITQRFDGTDQLLWMVRTPIPWQVRPTLLNPPDMSWGPFAARAAGSAYFNLVWPVALGFWWCLHLSAVGRAGAAHRIGGDASVLLIPSTLLMAACPWIAGGRSGALIALGQWAVIVLVFAAIRRPSGSKGWSLKALALVILLGLAGTVVDGPLSRRFNAAFDDALNSRVEVGRVVDRMSADAGWLGTGAGSFAGLYALYRAQPEDRWVAFAHNDWMETRITLGRFGLALGVILLVTAAVVWRTGTGLRAPREFVLLVATALGGLLVQAFVEFPFQIPALAVLFLILLAVLLATPGTGAHHSRHS